MAVDVFFAVAGKLFLVFVYHYHGWIEAPYISFQPSRLVKAALKNVFARNGVPRIRSDNSSCCASRVMQQLALQWSFIDAFSSPRYSQSNSMAECAVGTVKRLWSNRADNSGTLLAYHSTPLKSGFSSN